jgi:hypothetical protein
MELRARIRHFARPAAFTAALTALLVPAFAGPATADAAKRKTKRYPVVTSVRPMTPKVGETIVIRGRNFIRGKNKNTVVFKRDGQRAVFAKKTLATARQISVIVPDTLRPFLPDNTSARFRLRVLSERFSKKFTSNSASPTITALPKPVTSPGGAVTTGGTTTGGTTTSGGASSQTPPPPPPVCTSDEDGDLLPAALENSLGLDPCNADTDGDGVPDGYEYQSARDLNDDEYQNNNQNLPYPGKRPYPNALDKDADVDHDGDTLTLAEEYKLWKKYGNTGTLSQLLYSAGESYSLSARDGSGRRRPTMPAAIYDKQVSFTGWAASESYDPLWLADIKWPWHDANHQSLFRLKDFDRSGTVDAAATGVDWDNPTADTPPLVLGDKRTEETYFDLDRDLWISDDERDEDADGLTNFDEAHGRLTSEYWKGCYVQETPYKFTYAGTDLTDPDTDGDGVRDGADDQDHDDIPNVMELSRNAATGYADWDVNKGECRVRQALLKPDGTDADADPDLPVIIHPSPETYGRVNPFNPCLPHEWSRTCDRHPTLTNPWAPYDGSPNFLALQ